MPTRRRLATGIYQDASGIAVIYHAHGTPVETRVPLGTPVDRLIRWRKQQLGQSAAHAPRDRRGSLARDVVTFLKARKGLANYKTEKSNLKAWIRALNNPLRWKITAPMLEETIDDWRIQGYSQQTLRHRARILRQLFRKLDGPRVSSPFDEFKLPPKPKARPVSVSDADIAAVATNLRKQEICRRLHNGNTRARFLVLATCQQRPAELKRAESQDVDLTRRLWFVRGAKGGYNTIVPLNDEQCAAWRLFVAAGAWGSYDTRSFSKTIQRNGWPKGIRVYNLRHSTGFALSAHGVDLGDIQALYGHTSPETTRIYAPGQLARLARAQARLDGRFGAATFLPRSVTTNRPAPQAKPREIRRELKAATVATKRRA